MTDLALIAALAVAFIAGFIVGGLVVARVATRIDGKPALDTPDLYPDEPPR